MEGTIPNHPSDNISIPDGIYGCVIRQIVHGEYAGHQHFVRIVLWLQEQGQYFVTNIYLPHKFSQSAQQRL